MSLNPEVSYTYNPAYHIKRGWRLQVIDTALVTDFVAFRPGLTTTEQPNSDHVGTKIWVYITAAAQIEIGECVSRAAGALGAEYSLCRPAPGAGWTATVIGVSDKQILVGESTWIVQKGVVNAEVLAGYGVNESLVLSATDGHLDGGTTSEVGIGFGLAAAGAAPNPAGRASVYIDCK